MQNSFYTPEELLTIGFKAVGHNVLISRFSQIYGVKNIEIGNNVRIDDFCILSGDIKLGNYIHISAYSALYGQYGIQMDDYSGLSPRCTIFSASDDFSGEYQIGSMVDPGFRNIIHGKVLINKYCQLGSQCLVLPGVTINEGVAVGAYSLVNRDLESWRIYKGIPAKFHKERSRKLLNFD